MRPRAAQPDSLRARQTRMRRVESLVGRLRTRVSNMRYMYHKIVLKNLDPLLTPPGSRSNVQSTREPSPAGSDADTR